MSSENENLCSICLEDIKALPTTKLSCNHYFHINCINIWKEKNNKCPICRKEINTKEKKYKSKCCISPLELALLIVFLLLFISFCVSMIIISIRKLKLKKMGKLLLNKSKNKYKYTKFKLFFDLLKSKDEDRIKILKEYIKNIPIIIKDKIENFFDDIVEGFDEFIGTV